MKDVYNIDIPFTEKELKKYSKEPILVKFNIFNICTTFYTLFAAVILLILGYSEGNKILWILGYVFLAIGLIFLVLVFLPKHNKKIVNKFSYRLLLDSLGTNEITLKDGDLKKNFFIENLIFYQGLERFFKNNYSFLYKNHNVKIHNIFKSSLKRESKIDSVFNVSENNVGGTREFSPIEIPFKGSVITVDNVTSINEFELREIINSFAKNSFYKRSKIKDNFAIYSNIEIEGNNYKNLLNLLNICAENKNGIIVKVINNKLIILLFNYYFNFEQSKDFKNVKNLGLSYSLRKDDLAKIFKIVDYFIWRIKLI